MRFSLTTLLWLTAVFATGMGSFGPAPGLVLASFLCVFHAMTWNRIAWREMLVIAAIGLFFVALLPVRHGYPRTTMLQMHSKNNMKQQVLAVLNYDATRGALPPAYTKDEEGNRLHSWRTLLLPYMEQQALYGKLRLDEPWDSPANAALLGGKPIEVYRNPREQTRDAPPDETHYFAVVDSEALIRPERGFSYKAITDGPSNTILLIEAVGRGIRWHEPRDLSMEEAIDLLTGKSDEQHEWVKPGFFVSTRYRGDGLWPRNVAYADGHIMEIGPIQDRETARALLTPDGGEEIPDDFDHWDFDRTRVVVGHTVHWRRVLSTALFVGLAVGPFFRRCNPMDATSVED